MTSPVQSVGRLQVCQAYVNIPSFPLHAQAMASPKSGWSKEEQREGL